MRLILCARRMGNYDVMEIGMSRNLLSGNYRIFIENIRLRNRYGWVNAPPPQPTQWVLVSYYNPSMGVPTRRVPHPPGW
jgi:hypothetical protein